MRKGWVSVGRVVCLGSLLSACGPGARAKEPESAAGIGPAATAIETTSPTSAPTSPDPGAATLHASDTPPPRVEPPAPPKRERIRIHNSCQKQVSLRIERMNDSDTNTTLTQNTTMEERGTDGDEVRLLDEKNNVLHALKIEPTMQLVDIASNCAKVEGK